MTLTHLSLYRCKPGSRKDAVPQPLSWDARARLYRLHQDTPKHNTHDWPHGRRQRYASEQMADHPSAEEVIAAGNWKYEGSPRAA